MERVDELTEPPVPGRYYLVPTVKIAYHGVLAAWPVIGPEHTDPAFFNFPHHHYHIDARFLSRRLRLCIERLSWPVHAPVEFNVMAKPLVAQRSAKFERYRRRKCQTLGSREHLDLLRTKRTWSRFADHFAGRKCPLRDGHRYCPHNLARVDNLPVIDGRVVCPLHGLTIDAETWARGASVRGLDRMDTTPQLMVLNGLCNRRKPWAATQA